MMVVLDDETLSLVTKGAFEALRAGQFDNELSDIDVEAQPASGRLLQETGRSWRQK